MRPAGHSATAGRRCGRGVRAVPPVRGDRESVRRAQLRGNGENRRRTVPCRIGPRRRGHCATRKRDALGHRRRGKPDRLRHRLLLGDRCVQPGIRPETCRRVDKGTESLVRGTAGPRAVPRPVPRASRADHAVTGFLAGRDGADRRGLYPVVGAARPSGRGLGLLRAGRALPAARRSRSGRAQLCTRRRIRPRNPTRAGVASTSPGSSGCCSGRNHPRSGGDPRRAAPSALVGRRGRDRPRRRRSRRRGVGRRPSSAALPPGTRRPC